MSWLVVVLVALGTGLIAAQLILEDYPLAAAAACLIGAGLALTAFKAHRGAVGSARMLSEHRREAARVRASLADLRQLVEVSQPVPAAMQDESLITQPSPAPAPIQDESRTQPAPARIESRDQQPEASRSIAHPVGAVEPSLVKTLDRGTKGRQAAAVAHDEARPAKLFAATLGMGSSVLKPERRALRPIAGVVSPELSTVLDGRFAFTQFRPGLVTVELDHAQPSALVFEESAFDHGVWFGALRTTGTSLFADLQVALAWAKAKHQSIFVVPGPIPRHYSAALRRQATYLVRPDLARTDRPPDVSLPLLESLLDYVSSAAPEPGRSSSDARLVG